MTAGPYLIARPSARKPRAALAEHAVEMQVRIREAHRASAPLWEAAIRTGDPELLERCKTLATVMRSALALAREIAGLSDPSDEPAQAVAA